MERLKNTLEQYGRWGPLDIYVDRVETYAHTDFSLALENAKALLETISKEICLNNEVELPRSPNVNTVLRTAFTALGYKSDDLVVQISRALATIGQQMGNLRNEIGTTSHGKTLDEIKERNNRVDKFTRDFLIDSTEIVAVLLIRAFEDEKPILKVGDIEKTLVHEENEEFNEFWDEIFGEFMMGNYSYTASQILFNVDIQAYTNELSIFEEENK